ncbi:hypothetical protein KTH_55500 [Thermosporothrix hazakensis]|jgi:hypothetical protein|nr:hypothetical protein KTH_55500 [Thermosporothrix hazakensis]
MYDAEQLIPVFLPSCSAKKLLTVNSAHLDLFPKIGAPDITDAVSQQVKCMDAYMLFTSYAQKR